MDRRAPTPKPDPRVAAVAAALNADPLPAAAAADGAGTIGDKTRGLRTLRAVGGVVRAAFALGGTWMAIRGHADDRIVHLDPTAVQAKGGPIYREDLRDVKDELAKRVRDESEATRALIRSQPVSAKWRCHSVGRGNMNCEAGP